jgi:hypothetical protein
MSIKSPRTLDPNLLPMLVEPATLEGQDIRLEPLSLVRFIVRESYEPLVSSTTMVNPGIPPLKLLQIKFPRRQWLFTLREGVVPVAQVIIFSGHLTQVLPKRA